MKDLGPNLFICGLAIQQVEPRAPTSQSKLYASLENPFCLHTSHLFVVLLPLRLLTLLSLLCVLSPFLMSAPMSRVFPVFLPAFFPVFFSVFPSVSQSFSLSPSLFAFLSLYNLFLVGHSSLSFHQFTCIFTFTKIPRNHHAF